MTLRSKAGLLADRHVLIIVENLSVPFDQRVWRECSALRQAGVEVTVISPKGLGRDSAWKEIINGVTILRYPIHQSTGGFLSYGLEYLGALLFSFGLACYACIRRRVQVIQICNPPDLLILATLWFRLCGIPIIFDQHDLSPEIYADQQGTEGRHRVMLRILHWFERLTYRFSDVVMVVNDSCRTIALNRGKRSPETVFVVRNGPTREAVDKARASDSLKSGQRFLLGFVGMMGPQEGIDGLLRILRALVLGRGRTDVHLRIVGGGTVLDAMRSYARELGVQSFVTFTGPGTHDQALECIATADVCICPDPKTPLSDKCSMVKVVEYMSVGRAFVAFDLDEVRCMAGQAGLYAEPGDEEQFADHIERLLDDASLRNEMGRVGRELALRSLTWDSAMQRLSEAYDMAFSLCRR